MSSAPPVLVIGNKRYSSWSLRPWLLMTHFGIAFEEVLLPLDTPEFAQRIGALSPSRRVPALRHAGLVVWDSLAIAEYVNETWLQGGGWPAAPSERALARAATAEMHAGFASLRAACPMNVCRRRTAPLPLPAAAQADVARVTVLWRQALARSGGPFLHGRFGIVDAFYAPVTARMTTYAIAVDPESQAYVDAVQALPAYRRWLAEAAQETWRIEAYESIAAG